MVEDGFPKHPKGDKSTIITLLQSRWSQPFLLLFLLVPEVVRQHLHLARMPNVGASSKKAEIGVKSVQNQLTPTWWWWIWHVLMFSRYQDGSWRIDLELKKRGLERTGVTQCWRRLASGNSSATLITPCPSFNLNLPTALLHDFDRLWNQIGQLSTGRLGSSGFLYQGLKLPGG